MKAGTAASIIAFTYVNKYASQIQGHCTLEVVSDEETGGRYGTRYLIEQDRRQEEWRGDCVLNAEPGGVDSIRSDYRTKPEVHRSSDNLKVRRERNFAHDV